MIRDKKKTDSRRKSRILSFQALYFWESGPVSVEELCAFNWLDEEKLNSMSEGMTAFSRILIAGTIENIKTIDSLIKDHLDNWDISRVNRVDLAVLRMSAYSLKYQREISPSIIIDEAIGICREYGSDDSYKFVNGVLDSIKKTLQAETARETPAKKEQNA